MKKMLSFQNNSPGCVAQSVTCLATDDSLTADPGVASLIPARCHTFVEIDHEIISTVILLPPDESFKKSCCQLQAKVCARSTGLLFVQACLEKSVVRGTAMTIAVDLGCKATKQTFFQNNELYILLPDCEYAQHIYSLVRECTSLTTFHSEK